MKTVEKITDKHDYLGEIQKAFPKAQIKFVENFDDMNFGYEISPEPGELIVFKIDMNDQFIIKINRYSIHACHEPHLHSSQVYMGVIPSNDKCEPDFDFIRQLVKNYKLVG